MKPFLHGFLALTLAASVAAPLLAEDTVVSVTFDSITQIQTKSGETLDPTLFKFGKATGGNEDSSRASGSAWHKDKEAACRWALLGSFMKFQKKARPPTSAWWASAPTPVTRRAPKPTPASA